MDGNKKLVPCFYFKKINWDELGVGTLLFTCTPHFHLLYLNFSHPHFFISLSLLTNPHCQFFLTPLKANRSTSWWSRWFEEKSMKRTEVTSCNTWMTVLNCPHQFRRKSLQQLWSHSVSRSRKRTVRGRK